VGEPDVKEQLVAGKTIGGTDYKVHLDGYNQIDMLTRPDGKSQRREFFFFAETEPTALRIDDWKIHVAIKDKWLDAATKIPGGLVIDIKADPFERSPDTGGQFLWMKEKSWIMPELTEPIARFVQSLHDFPPSQKGTGIGMAAVLAGMKDHTPSD
jgi:arylsulfatase